MNNKKYSLGLSSFPLLRNEIVTAAHIYLELKDWTQTKYRLIDENLLQRTRLSTRKVAVNETLKRLKHCLPWEMEILVKSEDLQDKNFISLLLVSRQYEILLDLVADLFIYKISGADFNLENSEISNWFETLGETHREIAHMKQGSFGRLVNNTKSMLVEGGLIQGNKLDQRIIAPGISYTLKRHYELEGSHKDLIMMLKSNREIEQIMESR